MHPYDTEKIAFRPPNSNFHYTVTSFGLKKNVKTTYQLAMIVIFMICFTIAYEGEVKEVHNHVDNLRGVFRKYRQYKIRMSTLICFW